MTDRRMPDGLADDLKARFEGSPFSRKVGIEARLLEYDRAVLVLPFRQENTTVADVVHGGATLTLADTAATAAAWTGVDDPASYRGITADLSLQFIAAARAEALVADARVVRRGGTLTFIEVTVSNESGEVAAKALATYKLSRI